MIRDEKFEMWYSSQWPQFWVESDEDHAALFNGSHQHIMKIAWDAAWEVAFSIAAEHVRKSVDELISPDKD